MWYPWIELYNWAPFKIDALGLVTLLGAEEVNNCIGRLVPSRWLEYMPLLGAFVIAGNRIKEKRPAFLLYNISSGIHTTEVSSWLARWALLQNFGGRSLIYWEIIEEPRKWWHFHLTAAMISTCFTGLLVAMTLLSMDWYGLANAIAMIVSILVRAYVVQDNREAIDATVLKLKPRDTSKGASDDWKLNHSKVVMIMSDSKAVTLFIPESLVRPIFVLNAKSNNEWLYDLARWIGWLAFAVHIVTLGMARLASQLYSIALLVVPTILLVYKCGCDDSDLYLRWKQRYMKDMNVPYVCWIGSHLKATIFEWPDEVEFVQDNNGGWHLMDSNVKQSREKRSGRRQDLYAWLNLSIEEEASLGKWDLIPHPRGENRWAPDFNAKKSLIARLQPKLETWKEEATKIIEGKKDKADIDVEMGHLRTNSLNDALKSHDVKAPDLTVAKDGTTM